MSQLLRYALLAYRIYLRPFMLPSCRFVPSCSEYALHALERHGAIRGLPLIVLRLARCQPWCQAGIDPVP